MLHDVFFNYCRWVSFQEVEKIWSFEVNENKSIKIIESNDVISSENKNFIKKRCRRSSTIDLDEYIQRVYESIESKHLKFIYGKPNNKLTPIFNLKSRSSQYIGVSKNGENWQALINCNNTKKYIGTFNNEKEAVISYDFYAICLHLFKAKTNFTYTSELILEMLDSYDSRGKVFNASRFIERL